MNDVIDKIFMCQRHQLIRWGKLAGRIGIVFGLAFCLVSVLGLCSMEIQLRPLLKENHSQTNLILHQINDIEELRSYALSSHAQMQSMESKLLSLVGTSIVSIFFLGMCFVSHGVLSLRARKLAMDLKAAEQFSAEQGVKNTPVS